ncbi:MAG: ABC transporter permease, partial [SAR324 cluster bacterium]|nr:ABC transporter permease [SAR324 cluster bacterium]
MPSKFLEIFDSPQVSILSLEGKWRMPALKEISSMLSHQTSPKGSAVEVNAEKLEEIDTAGALLLLRFLKERNVLQKSSFIGLNEAHQSVIELVQKVLEKENPGFAHVEEGLLVKIGKGVLDFLHECLLSLSFLGEVICECFPIFLNPKRIRWKELFAQLEIVCINAIPIIILVSALIGFVLAYLFSDQLQKYGANIFIVEGVTIAMARELSPMIAAVVMAGRSGSSFTAQIGAMKLNEEIDAIKILGLSPMHVLVIPRIVALMVALPLLVLIGDV